MSYRSKMEKAIKSTLNYLKKCAANPVAAVDKVIAHTLFSGAPVCKCREQYQKRNKITSVCFSTDEEIGSCPLQTRGGHCAGGCPDSALYRTAVIVRARPTKIRIKRLKNLLIKKHDAIIRIAKLNGWRIKKDIKDIKKGA